MKKSECNSMYKLNIKYNEYVSMRCSSGNEIFDKIYHYIHNYKINRYICSLIIINLGIIDIIGNRYG